MRADIVGGSAGPALAVLGELDSLIVNEHPHADQATGAAHACGHHCQVAMLLGAAMALQQPDVLEALSGRLIFMAVPAEEYIEIEYRDSLRRQGKIEFLGGKPELVKLGEFDDVDLAMMLPHHVQPQRKAVVHQRHQQRHAGQEDTVSWDAGPTPAALPTWGSTPSTPPPWPLAPFTTIGRPSATKTASAFTPSSPRAVRQ